MAYWRNLLCRLLKIIQFLSVHNIALQGASDHEKIGDPTNGPILGLVELIAEVDSVLSEHERKINCQDIYHHYLGKHVQNELIELVGNKILKILLSKTNWNKYYLIILDCTSDISHTEQMSLVISRASFFNKAYFLVASLNDVCFARTLDTRSKFRVFNLKGQLKVNFLPLGQFFLYMVGQKNLHP